MQLLKSISLYTASNLSKNAVGFLLLPIITNYLDKGENGDLSTIMGIVLFFTPVILWASYGAINLEYFRQDQGEKNFPSFLSSALVTPVVLTLILTVILILFSPWLSEWLDIDKKWLMLIPLLCIINVIPNFVSVIYQSQKKPIPHAAYNIGLTVIDLLLSIVLIIGFAMNWEGRLWAMLASKAAFTLLGIYLLWRTGFLKNSIRKKYVKEVFYYGLPLLPHIMAVGVMDLSDRLFIREMIGKEELGIYDVGYKVGSIILLIQASLIMAWNPFFYEKMKSINDWNKTYIVAVSYFVMAGLFICCLLLTLTAPILFLCIGKDFSGGIQYVFWISLAYVFLGFYKIFAGFIFYDKKNHLLSYIAVFNVVINLFLNYYLIKAYGSMGAAYATVISYFVFFIITAVISNRLHPMPWFDFGKLYRFMQVKYFSN
jgi:O-antigen/teichoic acid export membrane protein